MSWLREEAGTATTDRHVHHPDDHDAAGPPEPAPAEPLALWRKVAVAVLVLGLAAGVVWQLTDDGDGGSSATSTTVPPTTAAPATPTTLDPSKPPELQNTGDDFDAIVRSVDAFENWVYQYDPDPKWVPEYVDPRNSDEFGFKRTQESLAALKAAGERHDSPASRIVKVRVSHRSSDHQVAIYVVREALPGAVVNRAGEVVHRRSTYPPTGFLEDWVRGADGRWRLYHSVVLGPPGPGVVP
ncbi:MAG: hypothetical protein M3Q48_16405 [Actinomycetota bacterium]|nr:hypothetical protein [Actinomycetota bacterium]